MKEFFFRVGGEKLQTARPNGPTGDLFQAHENPNTSIPANSDPFLGSHIL
jgi:hypothetical protein